MSVDGSAIKALMAVAERAGSTRRMVLYSFSYRELAIANQEDLLPA